MKLGNKIKNWGDPSTLSFHDCPICVKQGVETIKIQKGQGKMVVKIKEVKLPWSQMFWLWYYSVQFD